MKVANIKRLLIGFVMVVSSFAAVGLTPRLKMAEQHEKIMLEAIIPTQFNDWTADKIASNGIVNPQVNAELAAIYSQTLSRTFINSNGDRIMLSIAYGDNQSRDLQVHRPEVCYRAQGFEINSMVKSFIKTSSGSIPVMHLVAQQGGRNEPITYWVLIGEHVVRGNLEQGIARLKYGLEGVVPDGLLFRVSTISSDTKAAFVLQQSFVDDLLSALPQGSKSILVGRPSL